MSRIKTNRQRNGQRHIRAPRFSSLLMAVALLAVTLSTTFFFAFAESKWLITASLGALAFAGLMAILGHHWRNVLTLSAGAAAASIVFTLLVQTAGQTMPLVGQKLGVLAVAFSISITLPIAFAIIRKLGTYIDHYRTNR